MSEHTEQMALMADWFVCQCEECLRASEAQELAGTASPACDGSTREPGSWCEALIGRSWKT